MDNSFCGSTFVSAFDKYMHLCYWYVLFLLFHIKYIYTGFLRGHKYISLKSHHVVPALIACFLLYCSTCVTDAEDGTPVFSESIESRDVMASERQPWLIVTGHRSLQMAITCTALDAKEQSGGLWGPSRPDYVYSSNQHFFFLRHAS